MLYLGKVFSVLTPIVGFYLLIGFPYYGMTDYPVTYVSYVLVFYSLVMIIANCIPLVAQRYQSI